jgi:hypothetical protein
MFFLEALGAGPRVRARRDRAIEEAAETLDQLAPELGRIIDQIVLPQPGSR